ncbi:MAG: PIG-L family deacetylase [bacterium]|nr:PIG-L family deacetylase [bacterium]
MSRPLSLLTVLAHPDDESLGMGGTLARYRADGIATYLVCATRGERGRYFDQAEKPPIEVIAKTREQELLAAAKELGIREVSFLDYLDKDLDQADPHEAISKIAAHIRRIKPDVVTTFGPDGAYGHPDHIAISQFTVAACVAAADASFKAAAGIDLPAEPHQVSKLYYMVWTPGKSAAYMSAFRELKILVDGVERSSSPWPVWQITTVINTEKHWPTVWKAISHHQTQLTIYTKLQSLGEEDHRQLWGSQEFYRVYSLVNGGRTQETDLFAGLR